MLNFARKSKSPIEFTAITFFIFYLIGFILIPMVSQYGLWKRGPFFVYQQDRFADLIKVALSYRHILGDIGSAPQFLLWPERFRAFFTNNPFLGISALSTGALTNLHLAPGGQVISLLAAIMIYVGVSPAEVLCIYFFAYLALCFKFVTTLNKLGATKSSKFIAATLLMASWPAVFAMDRGNFSSLFVSVLIALFVLYVQLIGKQKNALFVSLLFFSLAITIRPNIAIFFLFLLVASPPQSYLGLTFKTVFASLVVGTTVYLSAHFLYPDYQIHSFLSAYSNYRQIYEIGSAGDLYNNSIYFPFKFIGKAHLATYVSLLIFLVSGFLIWAYKSRLTVSLYLLCLMAMLCTPVFADYHMLIFAVPIVFTLVMFPTWKGFDHIDLICLVSSIYLVAPKNYYDIPSSTLSSFINPTLGTLAIIYLLLSWILKVKCRREVIG